MFKDINLNTKHVEFHNSHVFLIGFHNRDFLSYQNSFSGNAA